MNLIQLKRKKNDKTIEYIHWLNKRIIQFIQKNVLLERLSELERKEMLQKYNGVFVKEPEETKGVLEYEIPSGGSCFVTKMEMVE